MGGFSKQSNKTSSEQQSTSTDYGTNVWGPQQGYLQNLYASGQQLAGGAMGGQQQFDQAQGQLGYAQQGLQQSNQNLQGFMNPGVDPAVGAYSQRIGQDFNQQFLPGLQGQAIQAGGLGGSRQQIAQGMGAQAAGQAVSDFAANSYAGQQQRALSAAGQMGQNAQAMGGLSQNYLQNADFSRGMPWYNQSMFSGLLGAPTMQDLGGYSQSTGKSKGKQSGFGMDVLSFSGKSDSG